MNFIFGSDVVPTDINIDLFNNGDIESLLGSELNKIWKSADMRFFNLETPLTDIETPIEKTGPNFSVPTSTIKGVKALNPTLVTLANNHILDHGVQGLHSTISNLNKYDISYIGAGNTLEEASKPYIIEKDGHTIGIYTCAEHEFTIATENEPGANPFDPLESLDHIYQLKLECDYVIVLYHGGKEHYRYPSPNLQKVCRKIVEKGADLVICQHSHCIGSFEEYKKSTIVYGQGNFIFNKLNNEFWNTSLLIKVSINKSLNIEYIPISRTEKGIELTVDNKSEEILNEFHKRSEEILQEGFIDKKFKNRSDEEKVSYIGRIAGFGKWKSRLDRRLFKNYLTNNNYSKKKLLAIQNIIRCEAHREVILQGLDNLINQKK